MIYFKTASSSFRSESNGYPMLRPVQEQKNVIKGLKLYTNVGNPKNCLVKKYVLMLAIHIYPFEKNAMTCSSFLPYNPISNFEN